MNDLSLSFIGEFDGEFDYIRKHCIPAYDTITSYNEFTCHDMIRLRDELTVSFKYTPDLLLPKGTLLCNNYRGFCHFTLHALNSDGTILASCGWDRRILNVPIVHIEDMNPLSVVHYGRRDWWEFMR